MICGHHAGDLGHQQPAAASMFERRWRAKKQMATTKYVERQIAVAAVVAVEETAFRMAMQGDVGGVQIEHDLAEATSAVEP